MPPRQQVPQSAEALFSQAELKPTEIARRKRKANEPKPVPMVDEKLWETYETDQPMALTVPGRMAAQVSDLLEASRKYLAFKHQIDLRLSLQWVDPHSDPDEPDVLWRGVKRKPELVGNAPVEIRFHGHLPMERGLRANRTDDIAEHAAQEDSED